MRQSLLSRLAKRTVRQGQIGQTIVIMAFGFIVLLAFVGIVTDVSLMFVRYTTLRRAVDAAAVAAAGQIRRTVPTQAELAAAGNNKTVAQGYAFARSISNINLAARQFIEFYGLSPSNVAVESCDTLQLNSTSTDPVIKSAYEDPHNQEMIKLLECGKDKQPRKLVRVTAQLQSPTVFLRLIGWGTVTLEASAISETAVLDVVLIFDAAETMLKQTTYNDWKNVPVVDADHNLVYKTDGSGQVETEDRSLRYLPVKVNRGNGNWNSAAPLYVTWPAAAGDYAKANLLLLRMTQAQINADQANFPEVAFTWDGTTATRVTDPNYLAAHQPPPQCRTRYFPYGDTVGPTALLWTNSPVPKDLQNSYTALLRAQGSLSPSNAIYDQATSDDKDITRFDGFVPTYDFYGCCNDPNQDMQFDDLICQPFKKVRDATEAFLDRVDFVRGDRVAFVTFDRTANLIDPDGKAGPQLPMITSQDNAVAALRKIVGVRAETSYYADYNDDGLWDSFVKGGTPYTGKVGGGTPITYDKTYDLATETWQPNAGFDNTPLGELNDYPVRYNCIFNNATLTYPFSLFSSQASEADNLFYHNTNPAQITYPYDPTQPVIDFRWPTPLAAMQSANVPAPIMNPNLNLIGWDNSMATTNPKWTNRKYSRQVSKAIYSYEFRAGCAGNNVGGALRVGNDALLDPRTIRIGNTGAVWVMVLLGDGAAGASDPVQRNGAGLSASSPYGDLLKRPEPGTYGVYGLCPYGQYDNQMGLTAGWLSRPPRCSDDGSEVSNGGVRGYAGPVSRHFCPGSAVGENNNATLDIGKGPNGNGDCLDKYDVDDYARDWADFIGLTELPKQSPFTSIPGVDQSRSLLQLPTIFTIGFGLDFPEPGDSNAAKCSGDPAAFTNINDCLGEELLRYIADVGDNNRLDTDYEQDWVNDGAINGKTAEGDYKYGDRGPCEAPITVGGTTYANADVAAAAGAFNGGLAPLINPLPPKQNCGNYYNAPGGPELTKVFEDIASRMFTRITK